MTGILVDGNKLVEALDMLVFAGQNKFSLDVFHGRSDVKSYTIPVPTARNDADSMTKTLCRMEREGIATIVAL